MKNMKIKPLNDVDPHTSKLWLTSGSLSVFHRCVQNLHACETRGVDTCGTAAKHLGRDSPVVSFIQEHLSNTITPEGSFEDKKLS